MYDRLMRDQGKAQSQGKAPVQEKAQGKGKTSKDKSKNWGRPQSTTRQPERASHYNDGKSYGKDKRSRGNDGWQGKGQRYHDDHWQQAQWSRRSW